MKNNNFIKISLLILSIALILGLAFAMNISAEEEPAIKPEIISQNIEYSKEFRIMYAVDATTATGPVELYVYAQEPTAETAESYLKKYTVDKFTPAAENGNLAKDAFIFTTDGVSYVDMTKQFYVQAVDTATGAKSEVKRYSVAEYLYERLASGKASADQTTFYNNTIAFGASAQTVLAKEGEDPILVSDYRYVTVEGGTVDGFDKGVYPIGSRLNLAIDNTEVASVLWTVSAYDANGAKIGEDAVNQTSVTVPDIEGAAKITVSFGSSVALKPGTVTFEDWTTIDGKGASINNGSYEFSQEAGHGNVFDVTLEKSYSHIRFNQQYKELSAETATAYETSFDIKFDPAKQNHGLYFRIYDNEKDFSFGVMLFPAADGTLMIRVDEMSAKQQAVTDIDLNAWNNMKLVVYKSDVTKCYFTINGEKEFELTARDSYPYTFGNTTHIRMTATSAVANDAFLIDNLFAGYTTDTIKEPEQGGETTNPGEGGETTNPGEGGTPTTPDEGDVKTGTVTFGGWTTLSGMGAAVNGGTYEFKTEEGHGTVLSTVFTSGTGSHIRFNQQYKELAAEDAIAFEASFDIKFNPAVQNHGVNIRLFDNESDRNFAISVFPAADGSLMIRQNENSNKQMAVPGVNLNQWNTIKIVIYKSDVTKASCSINGTEYELSALKAYTWGNTTHLRIQGMSSSVVNDGFIVDNVFTGYIAETANPGEGGETTNPGEGGETTNPGEGGTTTEPDQSVVKPGTVTFNEYTTLSGTGAAVSGGTYEFTQVSGRGQVLDATLEKSGSYIRFNQQYKDLAAENATAYEISFDIKYDTAVQNHGLYLRVYDNESNFSFGTMLFPAADGSVINRIDESSAKQHTITDINLNDWVNIKMVVYKSDPTKCYVSFNGGTEYELTARASYPYTFGNATHVRMTATSAVANDAFLIDNLFAGYTTETKE